MASTLPFYAAALAMTLVLANYATPANWWRRPTLRGIAIVAGGTWLLGALLLAVWLPSAAPRAMPPAASAAPASLAAVPAPVDSAPQAGQSYRAYRDLNLRADASTSAARLAVVPAGAIVRATGEQRGDWWRIEAGRDAQRQAGWASSLWLRRQQE